MLRRYYYNIICIYVAHVARAVINDSFYSVMISCHIRAVRLRTVGGGVGQKNVLLVSDGLIIK